MEPQEFLSFSQDTTSESIQDLGPVALNQAPPECSRSEGKNDFSADSGMMKVPPDKPIPSNNQTSSAIEQATPIFKPDELANDGYSSSSPKRSKTKKSVIFNTVTIYHFNRSQGFVTIPSQGGSTLGMKRKHFLRRILPVDLYEEVRRRSRREILLKIRLEKRKRERELLNECYELKDSNSSSSTSSNTNTSDDEDESLTSDCSDISDSELENDGYIFLQPIGVNLRRSLLRASGVGRIDPSEKRECNRIRDSRDRSGCKCVGQCMPEYCECTRLGVNCHVDRVSFPCGCLPSGCQNPMGRTEFDMARVRYHFEQTVIRTKSSNVSENDPSNSDSSYETLADRRRQDTVESDTETEVIYGSDIHPVLGNQTHETNRSTSLQT